MDDKNMQQNGDAGNNEADSGADQPAGGDSGVDSKWFMPGWPTPEDNQEDKPHEQQPEDEEQTSQEAEQADSSEPSPPPVPGDSEQATPPPVPGSGERVLEDLQGSEQIREEPETAGQTPETPQVADEAGQQPEPAEPPEKDEPEQAAGEESDTDDWRSSLHQGGWSYSGLVEKQQSEQADEQPPVEESAENTETPAEVEEPAEYLQESALVDTPRDAEEHVEQIEEPTEHAPPVEPQWVEPTELKPRKAVRASAEHGFDNMGPAGPGDDFESMGKPKKTLKTVMMLVGGLALVAAVACGIIFIVVPKAKEMDRTSNEAIAIYIALGVIAASIISWLLLRKTFRSRLLVEKIIRDDPDINDWLVAFDWTPKILYVPTICAAFIASILMYLEQNSVWIFARLDPAALGGIWFAIFFFNYLVEEYSISIKILIITTVGVGCFLLWLNLLGGVMAFLRLFTNLAVEISATGFLLIGIFGLLSIFVSWIKGLFYYVAITPNYMNVQEGPTESGEQIGREDYNSRIDTSDFVERIMGFGRIIITFKDQKRPPISLLVWRIGKKSDLLERVRGKIAIDRPGGRSLDQ